jgi:hypothetical protein
MLEEASNFCVVAAFMVESDIKERQSTAYFNLQAQISSEP